MPFLFISSQTVRLNGCLERASFITAVYYRLNGGFTLSQSRAAGGYWKPRPILNERRDNDGEEKVFEKIFSEFHGRYKNLIGFNHSNLDDIKATLLEYCLDIANRDLAALNVIDVFKASCSSSAELKDLIKQGLRESDGRLTITGEADEVIPKMKFICVKDRSAGQWILNIANEIDSSNGQWQLVEIDDPNTILFFQQRCRVSMSRLISDTAKLWEMPESFEERAKLGSDPIIALLPPANCSMEEKRAAVAMGLVCGCLRKTSRGYELNGQHDDNICLGTDLAEILEYTKNDYPALVRLYRSFVRKLAANPREIISSLDCRIRSDAADNGDLLSQLGRNPFVKAREIADALMPYIRRMPLNNTKNAETEGN